MIARARANAGALWLLAATTIANVLGLGYQFVMARLLRPEDYAVLLALFGVLLLESISSQVIQSATAKLAAQYKAKEDETALHVFVRRWSVRIFAALGALGALVVVFSGPISAGLALPTFAVALLGVSLFFAGALTFGLGLLQGLARFGWMGSVLIAQAAARLLLGVLLVYFGFGVNGAFTAASAAVGISFVLALVPLLPLFRAARGALSVVELGAAETRFFALAAVILLAYAALANVDAVLAPSLLSPEEAGAYAGAVLLGKIVLFAPIAVGYVLLERTARAHARGEDTERALYVALAFVLATSGIVALAYLVAPAFFVGFLAGDKYPATVAIAPIYGVAVLSNALLNVWISYFVGRGEMRVGVLLALAVAVEIALLVLVATDAVSFAWVVLIVAVATQGAAIVTFALERARARRLTVLTPR